MKKDYLGQKSPAIALHRSMFILQQQADELLSQKAGVGLSQVRIMSQLHSSVARSQKTVAAGLRQTEANISRQMRLMRTQGLVSIVRKPKDKRLREVSLTQKGARIYQRAEKILGSRYDNQAIKKVIELLKIQPF